MGWKTAPVTAILASEEVFGVVSRCDDRQRGRKGSQSKLLSSGTKAAPDYPSGRAQV